jgi:hypothetical protein
MMWIPVPGTAGQRKATVTVGLLAVVASTAVGAGHGGLGSVGDPATAATKTPFSTAHTLGETWARASSVTAAGPVEWAADPSPTVPDDAIR